MPSSLIFNIRERLAANLAHECSLQEFEDWFFPETWDVDQSGDLALTDLVTGLSSVWPSSLMEIGQKMS